MVGLASTGLAALAGSVAGLPAGFIGRWMDQAIMRSIDTLNVGGMITALAGLSFLGLGVQPPTSDWGGMLAASRQYINVAPHVAALPGLVIFLTVLGFNLLGDVLRDALDPRRR